MTDSGMMADLNHTLIEEVFDPIINLEGSEWGEGVGALNRAYSYDYLWDDEHMDLFAAILKDAIEGVYPDLLDHDPEGFEDALRDAQERLKEYDEESIRRTWGGNKEAVQRELAKLKATLEWLPDFFKQELPPPVDRRLELTKAKMREMGVDDPSDEQAVDLMRFFASIASI